jgi:hypothetical protein
MSQRVSDLRSSDRATAATRPGFSGPDLEPAAVRLRFACHSGAVAERGCGSRYSEASTMVQHGRFPERDPMSARSGLGPHSQNHFYVLMPVPSAAPITAFEISR